MSLVGRSFARDTFAQALSDDAFVRAMLDFERALAEAEGAVGVIPQEAARVIASACADLSLSVADDPHGSVADPPVLRPSTSSEIKPCALSLPRHLCLHFSISVSVTKSFLPSRSSTNSPRREAALKVLGRNLLR